MEYDNNVLSLSTRQTRGYLQLGKDSDVDYFHVIFKRWFATAYISFCKIKTAGKMVGTPLYTQTLTSRLFNMSHAFSQYRAVLHQDGRLF
jgi:hypothetical protein